MRADMESAPTAFAPHSVGADACIGPRAHNVRPYKLLH